MKRPLYLAWLITTLCLMGGFTNLHAAEVTNYLESFTGLNTSKHDFAPVSWGHIVESAFDEESYGDVYVSYTASTSGGQSGAYLRAGSQLLVYGSDAVNDLLVTPLVKGTISFYLKKYTSSGTLKLFKCTKNGTKFNRGEEITLDLPTLTTSSWTKVTLSADDYTYIGIRLENMCIDEFSAAQANVPDVKAIEITSTKLLSPSEIYADANGVVTIHASFDIRNSGNVPLSAGDYSFQMEKRITPVVIMTPLINAPKDLAVGETATVDATCQYTLADKTKGDRVAYDIRESLNNTTKQIAYVQINGYIAELDIKNAKSTTLTASSVVDYEIFKGERSQTFTLKNVGGAPLIVTGVNLPAGYSIDSPVFTIPSTQSVTRTITLNGDSGIKSGTVEFIFEGNGTKSFNITGNIIEADIWFEDFENGLPADWIKPTGSNWSESTEITTDYNKKQMWNSNVSNLTSIITPKLTVNEGEALSFYVARKQYTAPILKLRYSKDRQNWSEPIPVETTSILPSTEKGFKLVSVNTIPAGDYYISFDAGYIYLDNIYGYRRAVVDHDIYINSLKMPVSGIVNHPVNVTATIANLTDKAEAAESFKVELLEDGKVVAKATATDLAAKESKEFSLGYTPHTPGDHTLNLLVSVLSSSYTTKSGDYPIHIEKEVAADEVITGIVSSTSNSVPLRLSYNNSLSETIYKKEQLNLSSGSQIVKILYPYYSDQDYTSNISIWMQNTTDASPSTSALADTTQMSKVFYSVNTLAKGGSSKELILAGFTLPEGFTYTGENLRIIIRSSSNSYYSGINFGYDSSISNTSTYKYSDQITNFLSANMSSSTSGLPVIHLYISKTVPTVNGKVTANLVGIEGANVSLTSGDIIYNGKTDASGTYNIAVFQTNNEYTLSADKIGYIVTRSKLTVAEDDINGQDIELETTGANIINATNPTVSSADKSVALDGEGWTATNIDQVAAALGNNSSITEIDMSHIDLPEETSATFDNINPNCLIYVKKDAIVPASWKNVIKGGQAESITLENKAPFNCIKPFSVNNISYKRTVHTATPAPVKGIMPAVMETICLPFAVTTLPEDCSVKEFTSGIDNKVSFTTKETQTIEANIPYLLTATGGTEMNFETEGAEILPGNPVAVDNGNYSYCGTYAPIPDGAVNQLYVFDGTRFLKAGATTNIPPFRGYFKVTGNPASIATLSIDIDGEGTTGISETTTTDGTSIYSLPDRTIQVNSSSNRILEIHSIDGRTVRTLNLTEGTHTIKDLPQGIYLIDKQKVIVK